MNTPDNPTPFAGREPGTRAPDADPAPHGGYPLYEMDPERVRMLDQRAIESYGIPGVVLMENAAGALRRHCLGLLAAHRIGRVEIFCGPGNNGGDGLALARHLHNQRVPVLVPTLGVIGRMTGDAGIDARIVQRMGIDAAPFDANEPTPAGPAMLVDAVFGTGLSRAPTGDAAAMIERINERGRAGCVVLAVDVPSGLNARTGEMMEPCVRAGRTVSFAAWKTGFSALGAQEALGRVVVEDIRAPIELLAELGTPMHRGTGDAGESSR